MGGGARRFQFSLRALFLLTTLAAALCMACPWAAWEYRAYRTREMYRIYPAIIIEVGGHDRRGDPPSCPIP
jgi:hypothetical protein